MNDNLTSTKMTMTYVLQAIAATQQLRSTVTNVFNLLCDGVKPDEEQETKSEETEPVGSGSLVNDSKKFLHHFQDYLHAVNQDYNEVEKFCNCMTTNADLPVLGPSGPLGQDSVMDKTSLYRDISLTYQWNHKLHEYVHLPFGIIAANPIRKSQPQPANAVLNRRRKPVPQKFNIASNQHIEAAVQACAAQLKDPGIKLAPFTGEVRVLQVTVGRVFVALIVMRNFYLEKILVRGLDEDLVTENGTIDLFSRSQFECMRKISDHAMSALLEYSSLQHSQPEVALRYLMYWLQSYKALFTDKCTVCGKHLFAGLPPLWRDFHKLIACHDTCRPQ